MKKLLILVIIAAGLVTAKESPGAVGDIAIIGMGADTGFKSLSFVTLRSFASGESITFTDSGWTGSSFRGGEGGATYTFSSTTAAGTILSASGTSGATWAANTGWSSADNATIGTNGMNFSTSGDNLIAFTGTTASPSFLFTVTSLPFISSGTATSNNSYIPSGLSEGNGAVAVTKIGGADWDNIYYTGPTSGTAEFLFSQISTSSNWTGNDTTYAPFTGSFSITAIPEPHDYGIALSAMLIVVVMIRRRNTMLKN